MESVIWIRRIRSVVMIWPGFQSASLTFLSLSHFFFQHESSLLGMKKDTVILNFFGESAIKGEFTLLIYTRTCLHTCWYVTSRASSKPHHEHKPPFSEPVWPLLHSRTTSQLLLIQDSHRHCLSLCVSVTRACSTSTVLNDFNLL